MNTALVRLKLITYLNAARPLGQDSKTLADGLRYDGFPDASEETVRKELDLMQVDGFAAGRMDPLSKKRLLWTITDAGIETGLKHGVIS